MSLLDPRPTYSPFEYDKAYNYWELQQQSHWLHYEVSMSSDINDWKLHLTESEKNVVGHILKGFTQSEVFIQEYWGQMVGNWFKKPEIQMMAATFSAFESIHAVSYAYLNQSLGLEDFEAFLHEPTAKAKIDRLMNTKGKTKRDIALSLAIFSAFNEGVNLFSSFAVLLNFSRYNKLKGLGQIIAFSIKDECYSDDTEILTPSGFKLFADLSENDLVAQFDPNDDTISFVKPSRILKQKYKGKMCNFSNEKLPVDINVTPGHQMLYKWINKEDDCWKFEKAENLKTKSPHKVIPVSGKKITGRDKLTAHEKFLIALQADGNLSDRYNGDRVGTVPAIFTFSKVRKIKEFKSILTETSYSYKESIIKGTETKKDQVKFTVNVPISNIIDKTFSWVNLEDISYNWANEFISQLSIWDGHVTDGHVTDPNKNSGKYIYYSSTNKFNVDMVQAISSIANKWATKTLQEDYRSDNYSDIHRLYIHDLSYKRLGRVEKTYVDYEGMVYCVTVPTSAIVVRRQGKVFVSGNCLHSEAGCWLFRTFVKEYPKVFTDELKKEIYDAARLTVELEDAFIDKAFSFGDVEGLTASELKNFIRFRANTKLHDLGLNTNWKNIDKELLKKMDWFDQMSIGVNSADFFSSRVSDYAKGNISFNNIFDN